MMRLWMQSDLKKNIPLLQISIICRRQLADVTTGASMAYLKIAEGCGKMCTYCAIPYIRGKYRSIPTEQLLASAKELAAQGVKELILVAQETTLYGVDLYGEKTLQKLLHELCKIEEIQWIRLMYCYPEEITDELIDTIAEEEKVCHYLDIPEEGTPAASFPDQIENEVAEKWRDDIMALQQEVSYDKNQELLGKSLTVLIEGYVAEDDVYVGRTYRDAPDVDGMVFVDAPYELMSGTFVQVRITDANEYDLTGEMIE